MIRAMTADVEPDFASALVDGLNILFDREGAGLRPFAPAIQVALLKYLDDKWPETLHGKVAHAFGGLASIATKPDALIKTLCKPPPSNSHLQALAEVMDRLPQSASQELLEQVQAYRNALGDNSG